MPRDPADIRHAPINILGIDILVELGGSRDVGQKAAGAVLATLGLARRSTGVHQKEGGFRIHGNRLDFCVLEILQDLIHEIIAPRHHARF